MVAASHSPWYPEVQGWGTGVPGEKTRAAQTGGLFSYGSSQVLALGTTFSLLLLFFLSFCLLSTQMERMFWGWNLQPSLLERYLTWPR